MQRALNKTRAILFFFVFGIFVFFIGLGYALKDSSSSLIVDVLIMLFGVLIVAFGVVLYKRYGIKML